MPRVASLYLPNLATDRLRMGERERPEASLARKEEAGPSSSSIWWPAARLPENSKERAQLVALRESMALEQQAEVAGPEGNLGARIEDCSCPRGGGWRPGARWARREEIQAEIDTLPLHQRPSIREMGRRTEAAELPFKRGRSSPAFAGEGDHAKHGGGAASEARPSYGGSAAVPPPRFARSPSPGNDPVRTAPGSSQPCWGHGGRVMGEDPLITIHRVGTRIEIAAVSPEAAALGLHSGMPLTQARAMIPGLDIRNAEHEADAAILQRLALFAARRWTPTVAVSAPDGLWLDLTGVTHLFGGERSMCVRILRFCARAGFAARIAVADTAGAAHALARNARGPITLCPSGRQAEAISPLPLGALRLGEDVVIAARRLGIDRIGDLIAMPRGPLARRFGQGLLTRLDQALGRVPEPFEPIVPADPPSASVRFAEPIASAEAIDAALDRLMSGFVDTLHEKGLATKRTILVCSRIDGEEQRIAIGTARASRDRDHLLRLLRMKIEMIDPGFGIEAMRLVAGRCEPLGPQPIEGGLGGEKPDPDLAVLIDRLAGRLGVRRLFRISSVESDVPERSLARVGPLSPAAGWPDWPRPIRFLSPPERINRVMAELPDQAPLRFLWRGRMHRIARADGPERIYGEWWRKSGEADAVRDYFEVEDEDGARFWLYRRGDGIDTRTGDLSWWLQGMFG